ncbi:MAG: hypothetical protein ABUK01_16720 [Leptospirales bacterium]
MSEVILDTNVFTLLIVGQIKPEKIGSHKRTSIYNNEHYNYLLDILTNYDSILINPNIVTEVDNLLNNFSGDDRYLYLSLTKNIFKVSKEKYIKTSEIVDTWQYEALGITDSALLIMAKECDLLISGDSELCDYAKSSGINVFDFKEYVNLTTYK